MMHTRWQQFLAMAGLTTLEASRQPICLILVVTSVLLIAMLPFLITHTLGGAEKLVRDSALAVHLMVGMILGCYAACSSLIRELRRGTASTVLSKPVARTTFFAAKFCGVALLVVLFSVAATVSSIVSIRMAVVLDLTSQYDTWALLPLLAAPVLSCACGAHMNYRHRRSFHSSALACLWSLLVVVFLVSGFVDAEGRIVSWGTPLPLEVLPVSALVTLAILVLTAIAVSLAPRFDLAPTVSACAMLLMAGLVSDYFFGRPAAEGATWAVPLYVVLPNWQHFWVADALSGEGTISLRYLLDAALYAFAYAGGVLVLGALGFRSMELK